MNRLLRRIFGAKDQKVPAGRVTQTVKASKMTIEETIRRYEQLCAK